MEYGLNPGIGPLLPSSPMTTVPAGGGAPGVTDGPDGVIGGGRPGGVQAGDGQQAGERDAEQDRPPTRT